MAETVIKSAASNRREEVEAEAVRPPLKWAGGKRWQIPYLAEYWTREKHRRLVEPFCGGLAVTLGFLPRRALLNDINPHLINFYTWLKKGLAITEPMRNQRAWYYAQREKFNALLASDKAETAEAAALFYYLNRTGYNGLCRFNSSGLFNVPFGRYKTINYRDDFREFVPVFRDWQFTHGDFDRLSLQDDDFIYADPPYDVPFTQYAKGGFGWEDQQRAAEWLARHKGPVILSNQATPRILKLYKSLGFTLHCIDAPRRMSCTGDRTPAKEVLALRNPE